MVDVTVGQLHGYRTCIEKEKRALLEFKTYMISILVKKENPTMFSLLGLMTRRAIAVIGRKLSAIVQADG
ncbi:unnamed protein product [Arabis nemorensis]|uniref:Uncharacterized protein n=1 Tax=Arabis nemorensis TaxID=586526 RepID=A0A565B0Q0_9BRAS|nr:unnamed protein product [Arabis nemorensis]